jgi:hypothetical protein
MLGVGAGAILEVVGEGLLGVRPRSGTPGRKQKASEWRIEVGEITRLLAGVELVVKERRSAPDPVTISEFRRQVHLKYFDLGKFLRNVVDGEIEPVAWDRDRGIAGLKFASGELLEFFSRLDWTFERRELDQVPDANLWRRLPAELSIREASTILHVGNAAIVALIEGGVIEAKRRGGRRDSWSIEKEKLAQFSIEFATLPEVARELEARQRDVQRLLSVFQVTPLNISNGVVPAVFFKRSEIPHEALRAELTGRRSRVR